jgi:transposase
VEVDWAGDPAHIIDPDTGEVTDAHIFVGVMTYSQYTYVEAFINEQQKAWITAHIHMYEYFGGVAKVLVPDNCATAVDIKKGGWYTPELNKTYYEMAEHYGTAIIPARVRRPKDKPNAEGAVNLVSMWITAALRNEQFFSIPELNASIMEKLVQFNANLFQKKEGSRLSIFLGEEKPFLATLPATRFELADWRQATVQFNYHIAVDRMFYSVPHQYIKIKADVRVSEATIEIFYRQKRIASHSRLYGRPGQYSTLEEHMPEDHQKYLDWNGDRFRRWAEKIGANTHEVVNRILTSGKVEQQSYRGCMGLLRLAEKHSASLLEDACKRALAFSCSPSYKSIKNLLVTLKDKPVDETQEPWKVNQYGITRGAGYYGGNRDD